MSYSNGSIEKIAASSQEDLFDKILSVENQKKLAEKDIVISDVDFNFKVRLQQVTPPVITTPPSSLSGDSAPVDVVEPSGPRMLGADFLWEKKFFGQGVLVALIDSGYDIKHPLLVDSVEINLQEEGNDEDQNGFKNDRFGWDFVNNKPLTSDLGAHGTLVGSLIAASHTPKLEISIAPESKIIPIAALNPIVEGETDASGDANTIISSLDYALTRKVDLINASWGGNICSKFIRNKVKEVTDAGVIFVTAAGNENVDLDENPIFPGSFPFSLIATVGALNMDLSREENSNYGSVVDFFAFGNNVLAAAPQSRIGKASGTSISTPFITGALALLKSAFPTASPEALFKALETSRHHRKLPDLKRAFTELKSQ